MRNKVTDDNPILTSFQESGKSAIAAGGVDHCGHLIAVLVFGEEFCWRSRWQPRGHCSESKEAQGRRAGVKTSIICTCQAN